MGMVPPPNPKNASLVTVPTTRVHIPPPYRSWLDALLGGARATLGRGRFLQPGARLLQPGGYWGGGGGHKG